MAEPKPANAGMPKADFMRLRNKEVAKLIKARRKNGGRIPDGALGQAAYLLDRTEGQVRRYVNNADTNRPAKKPRFEFSERLVVLAYGYGGRIKALHTDLKDASAIVPLAYVTFWRAWNRLPKEVRLYPKKGIEAHRKLRLYVRWEAPHRNAVWQADVCKLDIWVVPKGCTKPVRPFLIAVIDDYSRMIMAWMITFESPKAEDVRTVLAAAMVRRDRDGHWYGGKPAAVRWDNGNEFLNKIMTLFVMSIRFDAYAVAPYEPTAKGKIERFFRTFQRWILLEMKGYSKGPKTKDKTDVFFGNVADLHSGDELIVRAHNRLEHYCFNRPHSSLKGRMTPFQKWCSEDTPLTEVALWRLRPYFLPLTETTRQFTTVGVRYQNVQYLCFKLRKGLHESDLIDQPVWLRGRPHDTSSLEVFDEKDKWLCTVRPASSFTTEELGKHGMKRDGDRRQMERWLKEGAAIRRDAASQIDLATGAMPTIAQIGLQGPETPGARESTPDVAQAGMGQLFAFARPTTREAIAASRSAMQRRRGPRRAPPPPPTGLPLDA